ncbi:MAG: elongation factor P hydroxylase [Cellvibrionales bacterium]|nr:elongation factor P hydroxylase [Cellvibrionales bacterium]
MFDPQDLIRIFNQLFQDSEQTCLVRGNAEPIYLPANDQKKWHEIHFAHGFFASALHEIAHWCIAGPERRKQVDYGYWYEPNTRSIETQSAFAEVEAKPQALEWIFHQAAGHAFVVSLDNLALEACDMSEFKSAIVLEAKRYQSMGLPKRAKHFQQALATFYGQETALTCYSFDLAEI